MCRHTTLDSGTKKRKQQLTNLFLRQSTGDIRPKLQKKAWTGPTKTRTTLPEKRSMHLMQKVWALKISARKGKG